MLSSHVREVFETHHTQLQVLRKLKDLEYVVSLHSFVIVF